MIDSTKILKEKRTAVLQELEETYKPFFSYTTELKKNIYRITFSINGNERVVRVDPQFSETELEDVIRAIENAKNAIVNRVLSDAIKEAKEALRSRIDGLEIGGHKIKWTYAFELQDMEGFMCPEDELFLPVEYDDIYGQDTYSTKVHEDWIDKAEEFFKANVLDKLYIKRCKCPDSLKEQVVEFAASQAKLFSGHDRYICNVQQEYIPSVDKKVRWHFEFGDFIESDGRWDYIEGSGIYGTYIADREKYLEKYEAFKRMMESDMPQKIEYEEGPGVLYGKTKVKVTYGPWFKYAEIEPGEDWQASVSNAFWKEKNECRRTVWSKLYRCFDNLLMRDIVEFMSVNGKATAAMIWKNLSSGTLPMVQISNSGKYRGYTQEEISKSIEALLKAKIFKAEPDKDGAVYVFLSKWGREVYGEYTSSYKMAESRAYTARKEILEGKIPCDEDMISLLLAMCNGEVRDTDEKCLEAIEKNKNVTLFYADEISKAKARQS